MIGVDCRLLLSPSAIRLRTPDTLLLLAFAVRWNRIRWLVRWVAESAGGVFDLFDQPVVGLCGRVGLRAHPDAAEARCFSTSYASEDG
jgi:hypothetical protein